MRRMSKPCLLLCQEWDLLLLLLLLPVIVSGVGSVEDIAATWPGVSDRPGSDSDLRRKNSSVYLCPSNDGSAMQ